MLPVLISLHGSCCGIHRVHTVAVSSHLRLRVDNFRIGGHRHRNQRPFLWPFADYWIAAPCAGASPVRLLLGKCSVAVDFMNHLRTVPMAENHCPSSVRIENDLHRHLPEFNHTRFSYQQRLKHGLSLLLVFQSPSCLPACLLYFFFLSPSKHSESLTEMCATAQSYTDSQLPR